jgi:hypothetical protein
MIAVRDRDLEGVDLVVPHMIKVEGIVKDENGRALPKLELTFAPKDFTLPLGSLSASEIRGFLVGGIPAVLSNPDPLGGLTRNPRFIPLETAPDGVFGAGILGLAEGAYRFAFRQLPPGYRIKSVTDGSTDLRTGWLTLTADRDSVRITAVLERVAPVRASGRVVGADSAQVSTIVFTANAVSIGEEVNVKPGGTFEFPALAPGSYIATLVLDSGLRVPAGAVTVGGNGTTGIEIIVPPMRNIVGRVTVEENGPPQTFNLLLAPDLPQELKNPAFLKLFLEQAQVFTNVPLSNADDWIGLSISPLPDGTFHFAVPEGLYQVVFVDPVFFTRGTKLRLKNTLRSLTYGSANLETEPMRVSRADSAELRVVLTPTLKSFQVSGRVSGLSPDRQREARVRLEGDMFTSLEVPVTSDGSFTFDKVAQGAYRARVFPELPTAPPVQVVVVDRDVTNLEIALPLLREIHGRMAVEGQGPPVGLGLQLIPSTDPAQPPVSVLVNPEPDGTFRFMAPDGEFWVLAFELPLGHQVQVQSLQWGATDLSRETLKISASTTSRLELRIGVRVTPRVTPDAPFAIPVPTVTISGRVTGGGVAADSRITLTGCGGTFETRIVDGAFEFSRIPQGVYMATVVRNGERFPVTSLVPVGSENRDSLFWVARQTPLGTDRPVSETVNATGAEVMNSPLTDLFFSRCR